MHPSENEFQWSVVLGGPNKVAETYYPWIVVLGSDSFLVMRHDARPFRY